MPGPEGATPPPAGVVPNLQHPQDVLHTINLVSQILSITFVSLFMFVRLYAKIVVSPPFYLDDWVAILAWILSVGYSVTALVMNHYGGGYPAWDITPANYTGFLKGLYADTLVYGPNSFATKLALLLIVIKVFPTHTKTVIGTYAIIVFMVCYYLPVFFLKMFVCRPISGYWDSTEHSKCFNQRAIFVADTSVSAVTDLAVLLIPIPAALTLRMSWAKRLKVIAMLSAGGIATAASMVRMVLVVRLQRSKDQSVDFIRFNLLGTAEVSIGMICACLPAVNILIMRRRGGTQSSTHSSRNPFRVMELKFLKGSRLQTQHLTTGPRTDIESTAADPSTQVFSNSQQSRHSFFFSSLKRFTRPSSRSQRRGISEFLKTPESWSSKLTSSTFTGPPSPARARTAGHDTIDAAENYPPANVKSEQRMDRDAEPP